MSMHCILPSNLYHLSLHSEGRFLYVRVIVLFFIHQYHFHRNCFSCQLKYSNLTIGIIRLGCFQQPRPMDESGAGSVSTQPTVDHAAADAAAGDCRLLFHKLFSNARETEAALVSTLPQPSGVPNNSIVFLRPHSTLTTTTAAVSQSESDASAAGDQSRQYVPRYLVECCLLARYLFDLAVDAYDKYV